MSRVEVLAFEYDEENEDKLASHRLTIRQVNQILGNSFVVVPNRKERKAPYLLIGRDDGGACIAVPIEATRDPVRWRPVTGWYCKTREEALL